jgi:hypothetical protein
MTRDEAIKLQAKARDFRRKADRAYDDAKSCDTYNDSRKEYHFAKSREYWVERDAINTRIKDAGFPDLVDAGD